MATEARNRVLVEAMETGRAQLGRQILGTIVVTVVLALGFGLWLARPLQRLEEVMVSLGENRLDQPIDIRGPTDVRLLGRRLEWLRLRLAELDADKSRFLQHVSHELKTPLAALREGVALLEDGVTGTLSSSQREVARILRQNTSVLQGQIEDLLRFNAAAFEARRLVRRRTELTGLIGEVVDAAAPAVAGAPAQGRGAGRAAARRGGRRQAEHRAGQPAVQCDTLQPAGRYYPLFRVAPAGPRVHRHRGPGSRGRHRRPRAHLRTLLPRRAPAQRRRAR